MPTLPAFVPLEVTPVAGLPERVNAMREAAARMLNEQVMPSEALLMRPSEDDQRQARVFELRQYARELGLDWAHLPQAQGGAGLDLLGQRYLQEILGFSPWAQELCHARERERAAAALLTRLGDDAQRKAWLEPLANGDREACLALAEEGGGTDLAAIACEATSEDGGYRINGRKWLVEGAELADFAIVLLRLEGGLRLALVPLADAGVTPVRGPRPWGGGPGLPGLELRDVRIGPEALLGDADQTRAALRQAELENGLLGAANALGNMWRAFDLMVKRATERRVHGGLLEEKQLIRGFIADSLGDLESASSLVSRTARRLHEGTDHDSEQERAARASATVLVTRRALHGVVDRAIQTLGALGVSGDAPLAQMYMDARLWRLRGEPDELQREHAAEAVLRRYHGGRAWDFSG